MKYRKNVQKILNIILKYGERGGISHKILADSVELDRKTVRKYTSRLMEARLVRRDANNGKYFPNSQGWMFKSTEIFCRKFRDMVFPAIKEEEEFLSTPIKKRKLTDLPGLPEPLKEVISEYIVPRKSTNSTDNIDLERVLFDFSNTIGGFVTYVLIKSVNLSPEITERSEDFEEKGLLAQKWIADILSFLSEDLIHIFEEYTSLHYARSLNTTNSLLSSDLNLNSAFSNVYPSLYNEFESIMEKLPQEVKNEIEEYRQLQAGKKLKTKGS